jgi:hypothetical protein
VQITACPFWYQYFKLEFIESLGLLKCDLTMGEYAFNMLWCELWHDIMCKLQFVPFDINTLYVNF